jgi:hypothetical protein
MEDKRKGAVKTAIIFGAIAIGVFVLREEQYID